VRGTSPIEELVSLKGWLTATRFKIFACGGVEASTHGLNSTLCDGRAIVSNT
jgi:hypothetical protein